MNNPLELRDYAEEYFHCPFCGRAYDKDSILGCFSVITEEGVALEPYTCNCGAINYSLIKNEVVSDSAENQPKRKIPMDILFGVDYYEL